jgi:hypothetical protein
MSTWGKQPPAASGNARAVGRHMAEHPHHWLMALVAVVVVLASAVVFAVVRDNTSGDSAGGPQGAAGASSASASPSGTPAVNATGAALARCRSDWRRESEPLGAAARALAQWKVHVGAMNQLVAGQITLAQAQAFWDSTRVAAAKRVARFQKSLRAFRKDVEGCPGTRTAPATGDPAPTAQLKACVAGVRARRAVLASAATAVTTWDRHVVDMEMLRMGHMTPDQAAAMWLKNWRLGQAQLDDYHHARAEARTAPRC